jgi:hypothetical protein
MRSNSVWFDLIDGLAEKLILEIFSDKTDNSKTPTTQEEIIDLGYAVVVDDEGNEIKNY